MEGNWDLTHPAGVHLLQLDRVSTADAYALLGIGPDADHPDAGVIVHAHMRDDGTGATSLVGVHEAPGASTPTNIVLDGPGVRPYSTWAQSSGRTPPVSRIDLAHMMDAITPLHPALSTEPIHRSEGAQAANVAVDWEAALDLPALVRRMQPQKVTPSYRQSQPARGQDGPER